MFKASYINGNFRDTSYFFFENGNLGEKKIYEEGGKVVYLLKYDKSGKKIFDLVLPLIEWGKDSVELNDFIEISLKYAMPISGQIKAEYGYLKSNIEFIPDTVISGDRFSNFLFREKLTSPGANTIYLSISHNMDNGDTLSADGLVVKHTFYVVRTGNH